MKRKRDQVLWSAPSELDVDFAGLELLPDEIVELIMLRLPLPAVVAVGACCSRLRRLASSDTVWRSLYQTDFPRGRTSSGGLRWRDVYNRAFRSLPASDVFVLHPMCPLSVYPMAYDNDRRRVLGYRLSDQSLCSVEVDSTGIRSIVLGSKPGKVIVDRVSGTYIVLDRLQVVDRSERPGFQLWVLDADLNVIGDCSFRLPSGLRFSFAIHSSGQLFALSSDFVRFSLSTVHVSTGEVTAILGPVQQSLGIPMGLLVDSQDDIVIWHSAGQIATYSAKGRLLSVFDCGVSPSDVVLSEDGIFAVRTTFLNPEIVPTVRFLSGDGRTLRCDRCRVFAGPGVVRFVAWGDDNLLVQYAQTVDSDPLCCLR
eukprot:TRINITY_DN383_c0_g1_i9.p1 TRINITY_DN383_c0_g1~~TRINITY_DN383_c0_g1_i9.p1  ORF type:complete len:368 (-),score=0.05 TRINITY_DN383_c0_g1_i9:60-1163(-)